MRMSHTLPSQDKGYPRDFLRQKDNGFMLMRGRARVKLFNDAGAPLNPDIPSSKRSVMQVSGGSTRLSNKPACRQAACTECLALRCRESAV